MIYFGAELGLIPDGTNRNRLKNEIMKRQANEYWQFGVTDISGEDKNILIRQTPIYAKNGIKVIGHINVTIPLNNNVPMLNSIKTENE